MSNFKVVVEFIKLIMMIYGLVISGIKLNKKQSHDDSAEKLRKAKTEDEIKDAARNYLKS